MGYDYLVNFTAAIRTEMKIMKNRIGLLLLVALLAAIVSCRPSPQNAKQYFGCVRNIIEPLLQKEDQLITIINKEPVKAGSGASVFEKNKDTVNAVSAKELDDAFTALKSQIGLSLDDAQKLKAFDGKTSLKDALIALLEEYRNLSEHEYAEIVKIVKRPASVENDDLIISLSEKVDTLLQEKIDVFTRESKTFAMTYRFSIESDSIPNK